VVFSLGSVPRWYFLWGPFRGYISLLASGVVTRREGSLLLWAFRNGQQLRVSKFCESEMATKDTHLVLWSTRATPGISASFYIRVFSGESLSQFSIVNTNTVTRPKNLSTGSCLVSLSNQNVLSLCLNIKPRSVAEMLYHATYTCDISTPAKWTFLVSHLSRSIGWRILR
jgi:hypothetical protein